MMNPCPVNGCTQHTREPMCTAHFQMIPNALQLAIYRRRANLSTAMKPNRRMAAARALRATMNEAVAAVNEMLKREAA